jgi:hypothetical protein
MGLADDLHNDPTRNYELEEEEASAGAGKL